MPLGQGRVRGLLGQSGDHGVRLSEQHLCPAGGHPGAAGGMALAQQAMGGHPPLLGGGDAVQHQGVLAQVAAPLLLPGLGAIGQGHPLLPVGSGVLGYPRGQAAPRRFLASQRGPHCLAQRRWARGRRRVRVGPLLPA